jgi:hypothetical protein
MLGLVAQGYVRPINILPKSLLTFHKIPRIYIQCA